MVQNIALDVHQKLDHAFQYFNDQLFGNALPACSVTISRSRSAFGSCTHQNWVLPGEEEDVKISEIAMSSLIGLGRPTDVILGTLVHEMCHLWQFLEGTPGKGAYHNKEWAKKMEEVGLCPSATGEEGGKRTGRKVSHYIIEGGIFQDLAMALMHEGFEINGFEVARSRGRGLEGKRDKLTCPQCEVNAWGKHDIKLVCGVCDVAMEPNT